MIIPPPDRIAQFRVSPARDRGEAWLRVLSVRRIPTVHQLVEVEVSAALALFVVVKDTLRRLDRFAAVPAEPELVPTGQRPIWLAP